MTSEWHKCITVFYDAALYIFVDTTTSREVIVGEGKKLQGKTNSTATTTKSANSQNT